MFTSFTITPAGAAVLDSPPAPAVHPQPIKFDAAFLERRMAEHRRLLAELQSEHELEIIRKWIRRTQ